MGHRAWGMGHGAWSAGHRAQSMGHGAQGTEHRARGMGQEKLRSFGYEFPSLEGSGVGLMCKNR